MIAALTDPALHALARIVRGADTAARALAPAAWGLYGYCGGRALRGD